MIAKAIVSGSTGFLGKAIVSHLIENGVEPILLLRTNSKIEILKDYIAYCKIHYYDNFDNLETFKELEVYKNEIQVFYHCAWKGVSGADRNDIVNINYNISLTIGSIRLCDYLKIDKWVGIGSQAEYGVYHSSTNEDTTLTKATSIYGRSKLACYWTASALCQALNINCVWCRVYSLYGPNDHPNYFIPYLVDSCFKGESPELTLCEQQWDYLHVDDCAKGIISLSNTSCTGVYNFGSGNTQSLKYVAEFIRDCINKNVEIKFGAKEYSPSQIMYLHADISKLKNAIVWQPIYENIEDGLINTINYYKNHSQS